MELITHTHQADGTHDLSFVEDNAYAVDQMMTTLKTIASPQGVHYISFDMSAVQMGTMRYFANSLRAFIRDRADAEPLFVAIIVETKFVDLTSSLLKTILERETVQYFTQPDKAKFWLRLERDKQNKRK